MPDPNSPDGPNGIYVLPPVDLTGISRYWKDVPYGTQSVFQKVDVYLPPGEGPWPTIVYVHGGAWMMCDKGDLQVGPALKGLAQGWAVVSVNYRLSREALFPAPVDDVGAAVRWTHANAPFWGFDTERVVLWGESAGAHLACHAGLRAPSLVRALVAWYCPTDFSRMDPYLAQDGYPVPDHALADSPESLLLGRAVPEATELVRQANPETWITNQAPPTLLQHGTRDPIVPWQLSRDFARRIEEVCGPGRVELELIEGAGHATDDFRTPPNVARVFAFLKRHTARS